MADQLQRERARRRRVTPCTPVGCSPASANPAKPAGQGETARTYIAAFDRTTGAPTGFAPKLNGAVWPIATSPDGKWVVIGGDFTTVNGHQAQPDRAVQCVPPAAMVAAWDPSVSEPGPGRSPSPATRVFFGGAFALIDDAPATGSPRSRSSPASC